MTVPDLLDYLKASYGPGSTEIDNFSTRFEQIQNVPLLILDDMGTESPTAWAMEKLYQILNQRYMAQCQPSSAPIRIWNSSIPASNPGWRIWVSARSLPSQPQIIGSAGAIGTSSLDMIGLFHDRTFATFRVDRTLPKEQTANLKKAYEVAQQFAQNIYGPLRPMRGSEEKNPEEKEISNHGSFWQGNMDVARPIWQRRLLTNSVRSVLA